MLHIKGASGGKERDGGLPALTTNSATYDGGSAGREGATAAQTCRKHSSHLSNITHGEKIISYKSHKVLG